MTGSQERRGKNSEGGGAGGEISSASERR